MLKTVIDLDIDLTDANRPMTIDAVLLENSEQVDEHTPIAELHGQEQDTCLIGEWVISAAEMERYYGAAQDDAQFAISGSVVTTSHDSVNVATTITVGGKTMDGSGMVAGFVSVSPVHSAPYECTSAGPILMFATGGPKRVPVQLVPAK